MQGNDIESVIRKLDIDIAAHPTDDNLFYKRGNAYWKLQDWKQCLDNYTEAIRLNPDSPAVSMRNMVRDILQFYNKEMYNV